MLEDPNHPNKLISEKSQYLLLHANSPVNWYPWCSEAFSMAKEHDKPIFLSIGGLGSHCCSAMLQESFQNQDVAHFLNDHFINIKVDKEELPYVALLYAELANMLSITGDHKEVFTWPLNIFLTPELLPFFAFNYAPAENKFGILSFSETINKVSEIWSREEERSIVVNQANKVLEITSFIEGCFRKELLDEQILKSTINELYKEIDPHFGGVKTFPKKTSGMMLRLFLHHSLETSDSRSTFFINRSLYMMKLGGIHDHIGGGFFSCSIDDQWLIPNFEKRLIDNAILALLYIEAGVYFENMEYQNIGQKTLNYLLKSLYHETGCFLNSEDGGITSNSLNSYYTWSSHDIVESLGDHAALFCDYYNVTREGLCGGKNILHISPQLDIDDLMFKYSLPQEEIEDILERSLVILEKKRDLKQKPPRDDLSLTCCNGYMIYVLVMVGLMLGEMDYLMRAKLCGEFVLKNLMYEGGLYRRWKDGESKYAGCLDDYSTVILGFIALFQAGCGATWLEHADQLTKRVINSFRSESGGFYFTDGSDKSILLKQWKLSDQEGISGNALMAESLMILSAILGERYYLTCTEDVLHLGQAFWHTHHVKGCSHMSLALKYYSKKDRKIYISLSNPVEKEKILKAFQGVYLFNTTIIWLSIEDGSFLNKCLPEYMYGILPKNENQHNTIYVVERESCRKILSVESLQKYLNT